ncbi:MAG: uracil-DNA glycosylase, partial [Campylobacterota bacterium]|nr:uracil-DNA glycosylase [Campylobacterota bacterium]
MVNIFKEIESDIKTKSKNIDGDLTSWATQGVLLINTILTVEDSKPKSHHKIGWEIFTNTIIKHINDNFSNIVFILWGAGAIKMGKLIDKNKHHILTAPHPSPLSSYRGFFGCKHFSKTNDFLKQYGKKEIVW